jgi:Lipocalin-like domain
MNKIFSGIAMISILLLTLTGCETDNTALLTDGVWKFENITTDSEDETIKGLVALGKALLTDATMEFQPGGEYILTSPLVEDPETGSWSLIGDDQLILDADDQPPSTANIETLTKKELKYIETYVDENMESYSLTTTWTRN